MERPGSDSRTRRRYLRAVGGLGAVGVVGCLDRTPSNEPDGDSGGAGDAGGDDAGNGGDDGGDGNDEVESDDEGENGSDAGDESEPIHADYETRDVSVETADGDVLGSVTAAVADTDDLRRTGLSDTDSLPEDRGMLFVHGSVRDLSYWMLEMDFGIDIVFADADGVITGIHHAPAPDPDEDGTDQTYSGRGKYVLEVTYRWTEERDVEAGDVLVFDPVE
ncbi:DUF192 domain-containing protein [Halorubrum sp. 48-1-W]|uniref:DUF192 domain-containing protein n=1 Tax=Halorubrum sp. 48-1-W TaxID=2249761 RepID=UPI000DCF27E7|nr:DUF192 domain-containing protein [Halorubrum sp. 48-1-W]RAW47083.1 DUF192 domain-containing protein [Halorubrum sp. 48-1-W]